MKITIFNGGRGASSIINNLLSKKDIEITSIVNAYDDGKSTGEIRKYFNMLGPSDLRKVQSLFLDKENPKYINNLNFFNYRLPKKISNKDAKKLILDLFQQQNINNNFGLDGNIYSKLKIVILKFIKELEKKEKSLKKDFDFDDCSLMNCVYAGCYVHCNKDFLKTVEFLNDLFNIKQKVYPNSLENLKLIALRENGEILFSESEIVSLRSNVKIHKIFLIKYKNDIDKNFLNSLKFEKKIEYLENISDQSFLLDIVKKKIEKSNIIIFSPGTQHSSLLPTYISDYLGENIYLNKNCLKVFISNIGADYENPVYIASDYIINSSKYLNMSSKNKHLTSDFFNFLLINDPINNFENKVKFDQKIIDMNIDYIRSNLENNEQNGIHDGKKIVDLILNKFENFNV